MSLWLLCQAAGGSETRRYLFSRRPVLRPAPTVIYNLRKQTSGHRVETNPRVAAEVASEAAVPLGRRSTHWFCTKADKASVIRWPRRMSQIEEKLFPEQIMMSPVKAPACLYPHVEVLQGTKRSVKESSNKSKKSSPQMGSLHPESARQHFRSFCYHDTPGPYEAVSQLQELCSQWLRPEIHSKEQILELLVLEQFLDVLPSHIQNWVQKYHPQNVKEAVALVDRFQRESGGISNEVTTHQLGNDTALLGGTAVAPGFKWKPAEPQPVGVFQEACSNIYQVLQDPGWNTHKESQPVDKGAVPAEESPTFSEEKSTPSCKLASKLTLPMSQSPLTFADVALYFSEEEWKIMTPDEKTLYLDVMQELYEDVASVGLKLTNDTGNDPPVSLPTLEIQPSGCEVLGKATMKDAEITVGNENHGDTCRVRKRPRSPEAPALASHFVPGDKLH